MKKIVIAEPLGIASELLHSFIEDFTPSEYYFTFHDTKPDNQEELGNRIADADIVVIANYPLSSAALKKASHLEYICIAFTGVDHVDIDYCKSNHIQVSNCKGYSTTSVSELVFGLIISLYRKIKSCNPSQSTFTGLEISGKKFGIIGTGAIGMQTALLAEAFGADIYGYSRTPDKEGIKYLPLNELLQTCDIISIHTPLNRDTEYMIGEKELSLMKETAILINTARGKIIDNAALAAALTNHLIAGAAIDVYETEPPVPQTHPLLTAPNVILTPHIGFNTKEALIRRAKIVFDNIKSWNKGEQKNIIC